MNKIIGYIVSVEKIDLNVSSMSRFRDKYKNALIIAAILSAVLALLDGKNFVGSFLFGFFWMGLIFCGIITSYNLFCLRFGLGFVKKNQNKIELALNEKGFHVDYAGKGILIDDQQKKIAFIQSTGSVVVLCNYSDVRSWRIVHRNDTKHHASYDNLTRTVNITGTTSKTLITNIVVTLASPDYPLVQFVAGTPTEANQWIARLDALINN